MQYALRTAAYPLLLLCSTCAVETLAQIPSVSDVTSTPVPNAGHDYIHAPVETVNPANGSLSIRIPVSLPPSRGLTLPFNFAYDSNGAYYLATPCGPYSACSGFNWVTTTSRLSQGGWSYSVPTLSVQATAATMQTLSPTDIPGTFTCRAFNNFVMQDMNGNRRNLGLSYYNTNNICTNANSSNYSNAQGVAAFDYETTTAQVGSLLSNTSGYWPSYEVSNSPGVVNPVTVTDGDGTSYYFGEGAAPQLGCCNTTSGTIPASSVTDRNGNSYAIVFSLNADAPALTYTDTNGRQALSIPTFGASTDNVSVSGLAKPYQVSWTTVNASFPITMTNLPYNTNETCGGPGTQPTISAVSAITLPNGQQYTFSYDPIYGMVSKITYPTGGYVRYVWGLNPQSEDGIWPIFSIFVVNPDNQSQNYPYQSGACEYHYDTPAIVQRFISFDGEHEVLEQDFSYITTWGGQNPGPQGWSQKQTSVVTSDLARGTKYATDYTYGWTLADFQPNANGNLQPQVPVESQIQYYDANGTLIKTVGKQWGNERILTQQTDKLPTNQLSETKWTYNVNEMVTEKDEYDFGAGAPGTLLRKTISTYCQVFACNNNIVDRPDTVQVENAGGATYAGVTYSYDSVGDLTSRADWLNSTGSSAVTTTHTYDSYGNILSTTDPSQNVTSYTYTPDQFVDQCPYTGPSNAYLVAITYPTTNGVQHKESFTYHCATGSLASSTDENKKTTTYTYNTPPSTPACAYPDGLNRLSSIFYSDGGQTNYCYNDAGPSITTSQLLNSSGTWKTSTATMDGLGHVAKTELTSGSQVFSYSDTTYDGEGRVFTASNPYLSNSDPTYGITTNTYDSLGRMTLQASPDGTIKQWCYDKVASSGQTNCNASIAGGTGSFVDTADENGSDWQRQSNALGWLTSVEEPNGLTASPSMKTVYGYNNPQGNLTSVAQSGISGTDTPRATRTFSYDMLSRLVSAFNPENGASSFTYDGNGNLLTKTSPAVNLATGTQTISYCYDALNRLTYKFWPGVTANCSSPAGYAAAYTYDSSSVPGAANTVGRLTDEKSYIGGTLVSERSPYNYDAMGRLLAEQQNPFSPNAVNYQFLNSYDLAGNVTCANNGFATVTSSGTCNTFAPTANSISELYTYDAAGRLSAATIGTQPWNTATYPTQIFLANSTSPASYDPMGHLVNAKFAINASTSAAAIQVARQYDNRGRIQSEIDTGNGTNAGAAGSAGIITMAGTEVGPLTVSATSGTGVLSVTGSDGFQVVCSTIYVTVNEGGEYVRVPETVCNQVNDTGTLSVTLGGFTSTATYAGGTSDASVAQQLAAGFAASGSPVTAVQSGSSITLTANTTGNGTNYPITISNGGGYTISDPRATLTGGHSASTSVYDAGTATVTIVNNAITYTATANWGQGSSQATVGASLVSAINSVAGSIVTAKQDPNSGDVLLSSKASGLATDYSVSAAIADSQQVAYPSNFPNPSFSISANAMAGGDTAGTLYAYFVPAGGYAPNGNILSQTDSVMGTWNYTYDTLNRLTGSVAGSNVPSPLAGLYGCWTYDGFGNRTLEAYSTASSTPCAAGANANAQYTATPQSAAANNRLASTLATYDGAGNVTADSRNAYLYDPEGRLCAVETNLAGTPAYTQYLYDAEGRRVAKGSGTSLSCNAPTAANGFTLTSQYLLDQSGEQASELTGAGAWLHSNVWQGGRLTGTYDARGLHFALSDPLGTKRVQATVTATGLGAPELNFLTLPYGNNLGNTLTTAAVSVGAGGTDATEHHFTGKERDTESGNDYFGARYYASTMGRFMSPDWSDKPDPIPYADLEDPQTLNLYSYVRNNPLTRRDLNGHCTNGGKEQGFWWCLFHESDQDRAAKAQRIENERQAILHGRHADGSPLTDAERTRIERAGQTEIDELYQTILVNTFARQGQGAAAPTAPDGLSRDSTGKIHGELPDRVPDDWSKEDLEWSRDELKESIKQRKLEQQQLGEDGPHRERLRQEEQLLRQVEKKLSGS